MMKLEVSCHCGRVRFTVDSHAPTPYMRCYCSICRKTAGSGGFAINISGAAETLEVTGEDNLSIYQAGLPGGETSPARRHFCRHCGSPLWLHDPRWPDLLHPHASAIDTPLPRPTAFVDLMLGSAVPWAARHEGDNIEQCDEYPSMSIEEWHRKRGLWLD